MSVPSEIDLFREYALTQRTIELGEPASEQDIVNFENRYGIKVPIDVREYFLKINGVYIDGGWATIRALADWNLAVEYNNYVKEHLPYLLEGAQKYFCIGSYDISVWDWLIWLNSDSKSERPIVVTISYSSVTEIADNFADFLRKLRLKGAEALLGYD